MLLSESKRSHSRALRSAVFVLALVTLSAGALVGCGSRPPALVTEGPTAQGEFSAARPPKTLTELGLFEGNGASQTPLVGVLPYDLNTPLFSDYMLKLRFVKLPAGASAVYRVSESFDFPVGTLIAKTFACPVDLRDPSLGRKLIETRILYRDRKQGWVAWPYIWNAEQTEAKLKVAGGTIDLAWIHSDGKEMTNHYLIPNVNQCKACHKAANKVMQPIGPQGLNLNRDYPYAHGSENQLTYWTRLGILHGAPEASAAPRMAAWDQPETGSVDERARAWLDVNCSHCHNPAGTARNAGIDLRLEQTAPFSIGVRRNPVAAGAGSGRLKFDIDPGQPEQSILLYRIRSTHPGAMMPEIGRRLVHVEGAELIRQWIAEMPTN